MPSDSSPAPKTPTTPSDSLSGRALEAGQPLEDLLAAADWAALSRMKHWPLARASEEIPTVVQRILDALNT